MAESCGKPVTFNIGVTAGKNVRGQSILDLQVTRNFPASTANSSDWVSLLPTALADYTMVIFRHSSLKNGNFLGLKMGDAGHLSLFFEAYDISP